MILARGQVRPPACKNQDLTPQRPYGRLLRMQPTRRDFLKTARDRDILLTLGNEAAIASAVSGERPISWGVSGYRAIEAKTEKVEAAA